ncbi:MAG: nucleotidyltransferase family protein [Microthrixaceae bacterium]|nr:nucleotidyltransferase family protein [Microthrixaceae bacterium]
MIGTSMVADGRGGDLGEHTMGVLAGIVADPDRGLDHPTDDSSGELLAELVELARCNRVEGSLAIALRRHLTEIPAELEMACRRASLVHLRTSRALGSIAAAFDERGIPWAVVKGPAVSRLWPHGTVTRTYDDLDVLVSPCDLRAAADVLQQIGFAHRNRNWGGFTELGVAEIPFDDGSVVVDLHWNLVALLAQRRDLRLDTVDLLRRAETVDLHGCTAPVLSDLDAFVHLCCHSGLAGARNLRILRDVHLTAALVDPDDARLALHDAGCERLAAPVLDRAVRWFGPVISPDGIESDARHICGNPN